MVDDDDASSGALLVVLLETHPAAWRALARGAEDDAKTASTTSSSSQSSISPPALIAAVAAFVGAYELEAEDNGVVVLAVHGGKCPVLYRSPWLRDDGEEQRQQEGPQKPIVERLASAVALLVEEDIGERNESGTPPSPALSAALSRAILLCASSERPTTGEAEILSADGPASEGEETHGGGASSSGAAGGGSAAAWATSSAAAAAGAASGARERPHPRVLVLAATPAAGESYVPLMNCAFAAQRLRIAVDVCELVEGAATGVVGRGHDGRDARKKRSAGGGGWATADDDVAAEKKEQISPTTSTLLSQVAHLAGGLVVSPPSLLSSSNSSAGASSSPASLFQCLLSVFAPGSRVRRWLSLPRAGAVDMRASCFCHKRPVDVGFVCSVCLSIFCETKAACSTCGADFGGGYEGFSAGEKRPAGGGGAASDVRPRLR